MFQPVMIFIIVIQLCAQPICAAIDTVEVFSLPVGQGDCTYVRCPDGSVTIFDMGSSMYNGYWGYDTVGDWINERAHSYGDTVKYIFISHPDIENFDYLYQVFGFDKLQESSILQVFYAGNINDYFTLDANIGDWLFAIDNAPNKTLVNINDGLPCFYPKCSPNVLNLCDVDYISFKILSANQLPTKNTQSVVLKIEDDNTEMGLLLTGDFEGEPQNELIGNLTKQGNLDILQSEFYKISHHGASGLSNSQALLNAINPMVAFSSSAYPSENNRYSPNCNTFERITNIANSRLSCKKQLKHRCDCGKHNEVKLTTYDCAMYSTAPEPNTPTLLNFSLQTQRPTQYY